MNIWKLVCVTYFQLGVNIIGLPVGIEHKQYEICKIKTSKYHE